MGGYQVLFFVSAKQLKGIIIWGVGFVE